MYVFQYGMLYPSQLWRVPWFTPQASSEVYSEVYILWDMTYSGPAHFTMPGVFLGIQEILGIPRALNIT